jgi:hypothetical protein
MLPSLVQPFLDPPQEEGVRTGVVAHVVAILCEWVKAIRCTLCMVLATASLAGARNEYEC